MITQIIPVIDLSSPTRLAFEWGWLLGTVANTIMIVLVVLVFILGATLRVPGARRDIARVEEHNQLAAADQRGDD